MSLCSMRQQHTLLTSNSHSHSHSHACGSLSGCTLESKHRTVPQVDPSLSHPKHACTQAWLWFCCKHSVALTSKIVGTRQLRRGSNFDSKCARVASIERAHASAHEADTLLLATLHVVGVDTSRQDVVPVPFWVQRAPIAMACHPSAARYKLSELRRVR